MRRELLDEHPSGARSTAIVPDGHPRDLERFFGGLVREKSDDIAILGGNEALLRPDGLGTLPTSAFVTEEGRQRKEDRVACWCIVRTELPDANHRRAAPSGRGAGRRPAPRRRPRRPR